MPAKKKSSEPWEKPNPKKRSKTLTPAKKSAAKARAKRAGRAYPNLVDNMRAAASGRMKRKSAKRSSKGKSS